MSIDRKKLWKKFPAHMTADCLFDIMTAAVEIDENLKSGCLLEDGCRDDLLKLSMEIVRRVDTMHSIINELRYQEIKEAVA